MKRRLVPLAPLVALASVATACGGGGEPPFEFGIQAVALNLAFADPELAVPVEPNVIVKLIPAPPGVESGNDLERFVEGPPPSPPARSCPVAPVGSVPAEVVSFAIDAPPLAGLYRRHNSGTMDISGGPFSIVLPFPPTSTWTYGTGEPITTTDPLGKTTTVTQYDVRKVLSPSFIVTDRYELRADRVVLVRRTTRTGAGETIFEPSPAIDFFVFGEQGDTWNSAGVDLERGTSMVVQGRIEAREIVDVCGTAYDTYRVAVSENAVDLSTGDSSGTAQDDPNIYNIATQFGGLVVREDVHSTFTTTDSGSGTPLVIEFDYVSTVDAVRPVAGS